jgi:hypothetical protein
MDLATPLGVDSDILLRVRWQDGSGETTSPERVTVFSPPSMSSHIADDSSQGVERATFAYRYAGKLSALGLLRATRTHSLLQRPGGLTEYATEERFEGPLSRYVPLAKVQAGFDAQTQAMKASVECGVGSESSASS